MSKKYWKLSIGQAILIVIAFLVIGRIAYELLPQSTVIGSGRMYSANMRKGKWKSAVYWANCMLERTSQTYQIYIFRGEAYELGKKYDNALEDYLHAESIIIDRGENPCFLYSKIGRIYHKKGDDAKGYENYMKEFSGWKFLPKSLRPIEESSIMEYRQQEIVKVIANNVFGDKESKILNPYTSYQDFLEFMEKEHKAHGKPEEYEKYMELLREVEDDINALDS